ncbi:MAG: SRPBCC family protein [Kofleriaceae bacterium]|jgi:hypothetical protein|nr:SRPBCC family protein [Kofleriaceae bacterium]MBP6839925.1 SRPBCC family protein [Kofleriaceae bacterium]MBP9208177.1 SRPBCC family protein [Kofleriaceae bacterium]
MGVDVTCAVTIHRPRAVVAAFMFEPRNELAWTGGVVACRPLQDGPLQVGARVERTTRFLGREFSFTYEVVELVPERTAVMTSDRPFPLRVRYHLDDAATSTRVEIQVRGEAGGFFRLAGPLLPPLVRRSLVADLDRLRLCLR